MPSKQARNLKRCTCKQSSSSSSSWSRIKLVSPNRMRRKNAFVKGRQSTQEAEPPLFPDAVNSRFPCCVFHICYIVFHICHIVFHICDIVFYICNICLLYLSYFLSYFSVRGSCQRRMPNLPKCRQFQISSPRLSYLSSGTKEIQTANERMHNVLNAICAFNGNL